MTSNNPRAGWEKVGDQFYRTIPLYESLFDRDLELENYFVAGAPYGGALGALTVIFTNTTDVGSVMEG